VRIFRYAARRMQGRSERFTVPKLAGVHLHGLHHGSRGRAKLVLLHGAGANAHWWDHLASRLGEHFHVVALDFRGHGDSDFPEQLRAGAFSEDLEALLQHLAAPEAILVGHSLGAHVAVAHAARGTETSSLILLELTRGASRSRQRATRLALSLGQSYASREEAIRRFQFLPAAPHADEETRQRIAAHSVRREADDRFGFKFDPRWFGVPPRGQPELGEIRCPTLLLRGKESALLTHEGALEIVSAIPDARLVEISRAGHHVHIDRPAPVLRAMLEFLSPLCCAGGPPPSAVRRR
jgi:pimeloyl-ACP methyl ester carboxylesterase